MMLPKMEGMKMSNEEEKISKALAKRRYAEVTGMSASTIDRRLRAVRPCDCC